MGDQAFFRIQHSNKIINEINQNKIFTLLHCAYWEMKSEGRKNKKMSIATISSINVLKVYYPNHSLSNHYFHTPTSSYQSLYNQMIKLIILISLCLLLEACHYSCFNCTGPQYISCLSCPNGSAITVVEDPSTTPAAYWSSVYQTGTCVDTMAGKTNPLGIILFIVMSLSCIIVGTKESFYLFLTIQTFGLYNLVEIAWVNPIGYLLQAMQYLMIWNVVGSGYKSPDYIFSSNKFYRLNIFLYQTEIGPNLILIGIFTLISMVLLIIICLVAVHRKKQQEKVENVEKEEKERKEQVIFEHFQAEPENPEGPTCMQKFSEKVLIQVAKFLLSVLYLMSQQTALVLLVSLVFHLNKVVIILSIVYLHILIFTMSYAYYYRVQYFLEKNVMYINFAKKVILPIMVVVPLGNQFLFFLFAAVFVVVEFIIDCYNGLYKKFNRLAFYKILEFLIVVLLIIYFLVEQTAGKYSSSRAAGIACTFVMAVYLFLFIAVEVPIGVKERFFSNKDNKDKEMIELHNPTEETFIQNNLGKDEKEKGDENFQVVEMNSSKSQDNEDEEGQPQPEEKITKDDNTSVKQSIADNKPQEAPKPEPVKKKRRKQILDKELRMRYGI